VPPAGAAPVDPATGAPVAGAPVQQPGQVQPAVDAAIGQFPGFQGPVQSGYMWSGAQPQFPAPGGVMNPRLRAMNNWGRFNRPGLGQFPGAQPQPIEPGYSPAPQPQPVTQTLPPEETF
jgi:hypothetical protein